MGARLELHGNEELTQLAAAVDRMNAILAEELGLSANELRTMPPAEALAAVGQKLAEYRIEPSEIDAWKRLCLGSDDYAACFRARVQQATKRPLSVAVVVAVSGTLAAAFAFAGSWFRRP